MNITLKRGMLGRYDDVSPFIIAEDLKLNFTELAANGYYCVVVSLNGKTQRYKMTGLSVTIPQDWLEPGSLNVSVQFYLKGTKLEEYTVEPLLLKAAETDLTAEPVIKALETRIDELVESLAEAKKEAEDANSRHQTEMQELAKQLTALQTKIELIEGGYDPLQV